jgi:hypothetical protein
LLRSDDWKPLFGEAIRYVFSLNAYRGALKTSLSPTIRLVELDTHINDETFALVAADPSDGITRRLSGNEDGAFTEARRSA